MEQLTLPGDREESTNGGLCALFTADEIEELLGAPLSGGSMAGPLGDSCLWDGSSETDAIYAQIQVLTDTEYWSNPKLAPGYEALEGIGNEAYVIPNQPDEGNWNARSLTDTTILSVVLSGGKADRDRTVKLLRTLSERLQ